MTTRLSLCSEGRSLNFSADEILSFVWFPFFSPSEKLKCFAARFRLLFDIGAGHDHDECKQRKASESLKPVREHMNI